MIVSLELNSSERVILFCGDTATTYNVLEISLKYDAIFDERYATKIGELFAGTTSISYNKITSIYYQRPSKKGTTWRIDVNNLSVRLLQGLMLLFLGKRDIFANKNEEFYNRTIREYLATINGMTHHLFQTGTQVRDIYPNLKNYLYKKHSNVTWERVFNNKVWAMDRYAFEY